MSRARWLCLLWLPIIVTTSCGFLTKLHPADDGSNHEVISCVEKIANDFFTRKENVLIISGRSFIVDEILRRIEPRFGINLANKNSGIDFSAMWNYLVLDDKSSVDPYEALENMTVNPRGRYVIVTRCDPGALETAAERFWRARIPDVIFLRPSSDEKVKIFGYEIPSWYENSTKIYELDTWAGKFENGVNFFAGKFRDMKQHPLKVTVINNRQMEPDIYVKRDNGELKINGVGSTLVKVFAEKLNFSILVKENFYLGREEKNGTWSGPAGQLCRGEADISFTGILPTERIRRGLDYTDFYRWDSLHFTMKNGGRTVSWKSVFKPLSLDLWISHLVVLSATLGLVSIVKKFWSMKMLEEYIRHIDILRVLFNQSISYPKHTVLRLAIALWLIHGYLTTTSYTGSLVRYLSTPSYHRTPNTFEELVKSNLEIGGPEAVKKLLGETGDPVERKIYERFVNMTFLNFWKVLAEKERAVVLYRSSSFIHNWENRMNESMWLHVLEDPIISLPLVYYMTKGHPYRDPLNHVIRQIHSSGLVAKWMADYNARKKPERKNEQESVVLTLEHLAGVFLILLCGYVVSVMRFFYELYHG